jgi:hypothetical protein
MIVYGCRRKRVFYCRNWFVAEVGFVVDIGSVVDIVLLSKVRRGLSLSGTGSRPKSFLKEMARDPTLSSAFPDLESDMGFLPVDVDSNGLLNV